MKILKKLELQQIAFNHSSDTDFRNFINLYEKCITKSFSLVYDATLASDNPSRFKKHLLEKIQKLIMRTDNKIRDENLKYGINREAAKL